MTLADALAAGVGAAILATVVWDVFVTVLHHWGGHGPLGGRAVHGAWHAAVRLARFVPARRRRA